MPEELYREVPEVSPGEGIDTASLPESPGCYLFRDRDGAILYIGKAKNLKKRVSSYFHKKDHEARIQNMLDQVADLDFIVTSTEVEAFILENNLIKANKPKYNIDLRDAKNYAYIHLSDDQFPRIGIARQHMGRGNYYGPFTSAAERDRVLHLAKKIFRLRSCRTMRKRPCLRCHLGTCSAPCQSRLTRDEYLGQVRHADLFLKGKTGDLVRDLEQQMKEKSDSAKFEEALLIRDQISALKHLSSRQYVQRRPGCDEDCINYLEVDGTTFLTIFSIQNGRLLEKQDFHFPARSGFLEEFIVQYYGDNEPPSEVIVPEPLPSAVAGYLSHRLGKKVTITVPKAGEKKHLLDLVRKNIEASQQGGRMKVAALMAALSLEKEPSVIECFDISHTGGTAVVGSMVRFRDGKPEKKEYRRFRIKTVEGIDDFAAIGEVVARRYSRLAREGAPFPDLVLIDGGRGQLNAALDSLDHQGITIPVAAIAKREEEIYLPSWPYPLKLRRNDRGLLYLREVRDEAHRFAIAYHRLLRKKELRP